MSNEHQSTDHGSMKSYVTGLAISIVLTLVAFGVVTLGNFSTTAMALTISIAAIVQVLVQLILFMHLNVDDDGGWNVTSLAFAVVILVLVIAGSLWIMHHLHMNMM
ncbi:cytochrome o ubiquinol oxidase subunit IV [Kushneria aurantia]|uniref:Cytochrome bo(3) ubiquinol oxidase subunit 4 n=1 Tax=Kushneria aurantia TaxID=504092 RepID=A0ABV6G687_9GAMM|nr:cytochrome o ubiquinol oxidase subunit IV [Kushneria aurantia]